MNRQCSVGVVRNSEIQSVTRRRKISVLVKIQSRYCCGINSTNLSAISGFLNIIIYMTKTLMAKSRKKVKTVVSAVLDLDMDFFAEVFAFFFDFVALLFAFVCASFISLFISLLLLLLWVFDFFALDLAFLAADFFDFAFSGGFSSAAMSSVRMLCSVKASS
ncbi:unnamed protein product [Ceratitis capitata]|uniref:(Mediterranean fruit fly) hypothetical protein n=1 Tax=Ceratitis capitata TaxID=7213 RepID=A0A811V0N7_CERCA|nr:unnamed protein product [Ceratitis capitata]